MTAAVLDVPRGNVRARDIAVALIDVGDNVRTAIDEEALQGLAESIREQGLKQPITVSPAGDRFLLEYGHRRHLAVRRLGWDTVPVIIVAPKAPAERVVDQLLENIQREDLNPLDEARALRRILDTDAGLTQDALAQRLGWAPSTVSNRLRLLELAKPVQQLVVAGQLTATHARAIAGVDKDLQEAVAKEAVARRWSTHDIEKEASWFAQQKRNDAQRQQEAVAKGKETQERILATLTKRGAEPGDPVLLATGYNGDRSDIGRALEGAGYKVRSVLYPTTPPGAKYCDCRAWSVALGYSNDVGRACIDDRHTKAKQQADGAAYDAKQAAARADVEAARAAVAASLAAHPLDRPFAEILLWQLIGRWQVEEWARRESGRLVNVLDDAKPRRKKPDPWALIQQLTDEQLHGEIAKRMAPHDAPPMARATAGTPA